jgi:hypothetical protein
VEFRKRFRQDYRITEVDTISPAHLDILNTKWFSDFIVRIDQENNQIPKTKFQTNSNEAGNVKQKTARFGI